MKVIKIIYENADPIEVRDHDEQDLASYAKNLSKLLEVSNVTILETTSGSVIVRPSRVCSILVSEVNDNGELVEEIVTEPERTEIEDIVTDGE